MKIRIFKKGINNNFGYKRTPKYATQILGIGLGEDTKYMYGRMIAYRNNGKWVFKLADEKHVLRYNYCIDSGWFML